MTLLNTFLSTVGLSIEDNMSAGESKTASPVDGQQGKTINFKNDAGNSALHVAILNHQCSDGLIRLMIEGGADLRAVNQKGSTALLDAIMRRRKNIVKALIYAGAGDANAKNECASAALLGAIKSGRNDMIKDLIIAGADVNAKTDDGSNACDLAVKIFLTLKRPRDMQLPHSNLVASRLYGVDITTYNYSKETTGQHALKGLEEILIALIDGGLNPNIIIGGAAKEVSTHAGACDGDVPRGGIRLLHLAVLWRMIELVRKLLSCGASVKMNVHGGHTALHIACSSTHCSDHTTLEIIRLLIDHMNTKVDSK